MSYLDNYLARINVSGKTIAESQEKDSSNFIQSNFADSPFYRVVKCNGNDLEVRLMDVNSVTRSNTITFVQFALKFIMLKPNTSVNVGDEIQIDDAYWIVTDYIADNPIYPKAKIELCNYLLQVKTSETKTVKGYNSLGAPQYQTVATYADVHCILRNSVGSVTLNQQINLPNNNMYISMRYTDTAKLIKENDEFLIHDKQYKVIDTDFSTVNYDVGVITFLTERVVKA